ncbi:MAG: T9SS type A sorting domain-containing protein [Chitinophagales bacterium]|nr:T9SS type A sorting domain-containing protein [Chitinophagales bacterium]
MVSSTSKKDTISTKYDIDKINNNEIIVGSYRFYNASDSVRYIIHKYDENLNLILADSNTFRHTYTGGWPNIKMTPKNNELYLVVHDSMYLYDENFVFQSNLNHKNLMHNSFLSNDFYIKDNNYYYVGRISGGWASNSLLTIYKIRDNQIVWTKTRSNPNGPTIQEYNAAEKIILNEDESFSIIGTIHTSTNPQTVFAFNLDSNGIISNEKYMNFAPSGSWQNGLLQIDKKDDCFWGISSYNSNTHDKVLFKLSEDFQSFNTYPVEDKQPYYSFYNYTQFDNYLFKLKGAFVSNYFDSIYNQISWYTGLETMSMDFCGKTFNDTLFTFDFIDTIIDNTVSFKIDLSAYCNITLDLGNGDVYAFENACVFKADTSFQVAYSTGDFQLQLSIISGSNLYSKDTTITIYTTGIKEQNGKLRIYPNPANNTLHIPDEYLNFESQILDISGKIVMSSSLTDARIDINDLSKGVYFLKLIGLDETYKAKFIKE